MAVIDEVARTRTLLAFDFDGTLAPMIDDRAGATMLGETQALLRAAALLYPCAVISGRARADVASRVGHIPLVAVIGNHGAEPGFGPLDRSLERCVRGWHGVLRRKLERAEGIEIEDKRFSIALHYRRARSWREAEQRIRSAVAALEDVKVFGGHAVVNVLPVDAPTKGDAIRTLCGRLAANLAVYVGDDRTDEDAFRTEVVRFSVRIGECPDSAARYSIATQREVNDLLCALIAARARQDGMGERWDGLVRALAR
jgi:trehalose 6-phosphate phosphatase